ncbi:bacterial regulatory, tetR family protein [Rhodococcus sp. MTM3W5.2]|uniref:TetR/AcrR family transcriptional regulator n=1 Tax=Rhodococcus sp. MTM3W5.2 TaxID=1805827 RepID=UPI00097960D4|nr:TetR/AcrR family transcriptional regulator [Rhodococcus sp. MTM3W5.2]AQA25932.1 bacterial regulatory, tetR family protein [Rhodococcus sp. MTM3W5.2]
MNTERRVNRGPQAAAGNRAALVDAARRVFAENGVDAPLSLIARAAGVGQGSLYRHFPNRESIILAVFEDNIAEIEELAARPESTLDEILEFIVEQITASTAFVAMLSPTGIDDPRILEISRRLTGLLVDKVEGARRSGAVAADVDAADVVLALAMFAPILLQTDESSRRDVAARAWRLLRRGLGA